MVSLPEGKMKSREGTVVDADDLLDDLKALARTEMMERQLDLLSDEEREWRAEIIGQAAIKYFFLSISPKSPMIFDPKKSIDFNGNTGPYCLYAYARTRTVFNRSGLAFDDLTFDPEVLDKLQTDEEHAVLMDLYRFGHELEIAVTELDPSYLARATYAVARSFSVFYFDRDKHSIINCPDPALRLARLALTRAVGLTIKLGLNLLGIETLERM
jgi:arginyl-tRNA synthetase